ncbi:hypothetical protein Pyn_39902 [Prunus yedoensis var. nudiflora]|uniref:DOCKER Lobe C domain-containing protein n=1 Tax=Prunus yedoensis var. nudiflora TaxID=2094558 RepID=A0A314XQJ8_PRUYE|nr:hypothetical protein Pyn_39902 [Prunus yedoensis var. nudiflora]
MPLGMSESRTAALRNESAVLKGINSHVNNRLPSVCTAFLSGEPATRLRSQELQQLIGALLEFMAVCKRAIRVHSRLNL